MVKRFDRFTTLTWLALALSIGGCGDDGSGASGGEGGSGATGGSDTGGSGTGGEAPTCPGNLLECGGVCVDTDFNPDHCGDCDSPCGAGDVCSQGTCSFECNGGTTECNGLCFDTNLDPEHCGDCVTACGAGEVCSAGMCGLSCTGGTTECNGLCVDTDVDPEHCGDCTTVCGAGEVCSGGNCGLECTGGTTECSGSCVDTDVDPEHCGDCITVCGAGEVCSGGDCGLECTGGTTECSGVCVDTDVDADHCGDCATSCAAGEVCVDGDCELSCPPGLLDCGGSCIDPNTNSSFCGASSDCSGANAGDTCLAPEACVSGSCGRLCASSDDCNSSAAICSNNVCVVPLDCSEIIENIPTAADGVYTIDPDGNGSLAAFDAYCDMTTDGGGWTIIAAYAGADGEDPLTSNTERSGDPLSFEHYNINRAKKMALSLISTESILRETETWLKLGSPLFDQNLDTANYRMPGTAVVIEADDGTRADGFMSYANFSIDSGGDFGISQNPDGSTCAGVTSNGFDQHSSAYINLNCGCERQYFYGYSSYQADGDAGYDVNVSLGSWSTTNTCDAAEGGSLRFYAAMRRVQGGTSCSALLAADPTLTDGIYALDVDGSGPIPSASAYCDMTNGGWTLLVSANATSTYFGNNSVNWDTIHTTGSTPSSIQVTADDYKAQAYTTLTTNQIKLCYEDVTKCHVFSHNMNISLQSFFANNITYTEYASDVLYYADTGTSSIKDTYLTELGIPESGQICYWLGINHTQMASAIGLLGDVNFGCASMNGGNSNDWLDDQAIGLGLQSCVDTNGCGPGGSDHTAGRELYAGGGADLGPWFVFGK